MYTEQLSQQLAVVGSVVPATAAAGTGVTEAIDISKSRRFLAVGFLGNPGAAGSAQITVSGATASGATYTNIASASSALIAASGVITAEVTSESIVSLGLNYNWLKFGFAISGNSVSGQSLVVLAGGGSRYEPANAQNRSYVTNSTVF